MINFPQKRGLLPTTASPSCITHHPSRQVAKLAYYPTTRQFSNPPAARLAARLAELTPGDLKYTLFAVSGSEANERSMQIDRPLVAGLA